MKSTPVTFCTRTGMLFVISATSLVNLEAPIEASLDVDTILSLLTWFRDCPTSDVI